MYFKTYKLLAVNIFILSIFVIGYLYGTISQFFTNDVTHISYILAALMLTNVGLRIWSVYDQEKHYDSKSSAGKVAFLHYIIGQLFYIGILGTVIGFSRIIVAIQDLSDVSQVLHLMASGAQTLFSTTAVGIVAYLWTRLNNYLAEGE